MALAAKYGEPRLLDAFVQDKPYPRSVPRKAENRIANCIEGCSAVPLAVRADSRGRLIEFLTIRDEPIWALTHVYQVFCEVGSLRGWVYHRRQHDRLAYTNGRLRIVLYDLREDSPTYGRTNDFVVGEENPVLVTIPPFVAHCVENIGSAPASFVNLPTRPYDLSDPDKYRLSVAAGLIPYPDSPPGS